MAAVIVPGKSDAEDCQFFGPAGAVDGLAIEQNAIEVEQNGLEFGHLEEERSA